MKPGLESSNEHMKSSPEAKGEETPAEEKAEEKSGSEGMIEKIMGLSDTELSHLLGHTRKLEQVKEDVHAMHKLTGKARELAEEKLERLLTPEIGEHQFRYALEDAQREAKPHKTGPEAYADASPTSVV